MAHPHVDLLRGIDEAQMKGDMDGFFSAFTDDVIAHIGGNSPVAGTHKGKDQFQALFERFMGLVGEYSFEPHGYLADDEHGVNLQRSKMSRGGKTLETSDMIVCHFREGKVAEMWFVTENQSALDAWMAG